MHEFSDFKAAFARNQMRQQRIACNIERHAQKNVPASLVKLTAEFSVVYVKLEQWMARRQSACRHVFRIPCGDDQTPWIRIGLDFFNHVLDLIDRLAIARLPVTPLCTVNVAQITVFFGKFVIIDHSVAKKFHLFPIDFVKFRVFLAAQAKIRHIRSFVLVWFNPFFECPFVPNVVFVLKKILNVRIAV